MKSILLTHTWYIYFYLFFPNLELILFVIAYPSNTLYYSFETGS